jgi:hypothetical protein
MNEHEEEQLAALLRKALREEAARHVPAGDGLSLIRERVARRRRLSWARPVLVMGAVAAVAAAAAILPGTLRGVHRGPDRTDAGGAGTIATSGLVTPDQATAPVTPHPSRTVSIEAEPKVTLPPQAGVSDVATVWPYGSRAEGYYRAQQDVRTGRHPELYDASDTALSFVHRYVGAGLKLVPGPTAPSSDGGVSVVVSRLLRDGTEHPVTRVLLVKVSVDAKAPYVVASAERPDLSDVNPADKGSYDSLTVDPPVAGTDLIKVSGQARRLSTPLAPQVRVELCDATGASLSFRKITAGQQVSEHVFGWSTTVAVEPDQVDQAVSIAAWTLDDRGDPLEFVATPAPTSTAGTATGGTPTDGTSTDGTSTDGTSTDGTSAGGAPPTVSTPTGGPAN